MWLVALASILAICFETPRVLSQDTRSGQRSGSALTIGSGPSYMTRGTGTDYSYMGDGSVSGGGRRMAGGSGGSHMVGRSRDAPYVAAGGRESYLIGGSGSGGRHHIVGRGRGSYIDGGSGRRGELYMTAMGGGSYMDRGAGVPIARGPRGGHDRGFPPAGYSSGGERYYAPRVDGIGSGRTRLQGSSGGSRSGDGAIVETRMGRERGGRGESGGIGRPPPDGYIGARGGQNHFPVNGGYCPGDMCSDGGAQAGIGNGYGMGSLDMMLERIRANINEDIRSYEADAGGPAVTGGSGTGGHMGAGMPGMSGHMGGGLPGLGTPMVGGMPSVGTPMLGGMPGMGGPVGGDGMPVMFGSFGGAGYGGPMGGPVPGMGTPMIY